MRTPRAAASDASDCPRPVVSLPSLIEHDPLLRLVREQRRREPQRAADVGRGRGWARTRSGRCPRARPAAARPARPGRRRRPPPGRRPAAAPAPRARTPRPCCAARLPPTLSERSTTNTVVSRSTGSSSRSRRAPAPAPSAPPCAARGSAGGGPARGGGARRGSAAASTRDQDQPRRPGARAWRPRSAAQRRLLRRQPGVRAVRHAAPLPDAAGAVTLVQQPLGHQDRAARSRPPAATTRHAPSGAAVLGPRARCPAPRGGCRRRARCSTPRARTGRPRTSVGRSSGPAATDGRRVDAAGRSRCGRRRGPRTPSRPACGRDLLDPVDAELVRLDERDASGLRCAPGRELLDRSVRAA